MQLNEYQDKTDQTDIYSPDINTYVDGLEIPDKTKADNLKNLLGLTYVILGIAGEAGELANKMKKIIRDNNGQLNLSNLTDLAKENGDVTWYNARIFKHLGFSFDEGAELNLKKLFARKEQDKLTGSGDNRES
jgi:NTP pyrophosphatase (non-canonical NTP hydrolase)